MHHLLAALLLLQGGPSLEHLDGLAQRRDYQAIQRLVLPASIEKDNPLPVIKSNGAYDTGRYGWRAAEAVAPDGQAYVVLTTALTSQDVGDLVFARDKAALRYVPESNAMGIHIVRHNLTVRVDAANRSVSLRDDLSLTKTRAAGKHFLVRMSPYLRIHSAAIDGSNVPFSQAGGVTVLSTPEQEEFTLTLNYSGKPNLTRYAGGFVESEVQLTNDYWYPMIARQPSPHDLTVHTPKTWTTVGQGDLVSVVETATEKITKFKMDMQTVYFSFSAAPYKSHFQKGKVAEFGAWSLKMPAEDMKLQAELYDPVFTYFSEAFAPYPFKRFGALVTDIYGGGALEAYSFATYGTGWLPDVDAHEPAHTWFGGMLNNTYLRSLWNESFADYCEGLYRREGPIGNKAEKRLAFVKDARPDTSYERATCADSPPWIGPASIALGYGKGSAVLQALESELGTELMVRTLREWIKADTGKAVNWADYERVVERVASRPMKWFFDQWLRRKGWPKFTIGRVNWQNGMLNGSVIFQGEPYTIHLETLLIFPDGTRQTVKIDTTQTPASDGYRFQVPVAKKPSIVSIDPWRKVLRETSPTEEPVSLASLARSLKRYSDPKKPSYLRELRIPPIKTLPSDLNGVLLVGHPDTLPEMKPLVTKAGFVVAGDKLTYRGTTIDLRKGAALAVVELGGGKRCVIGLGTTRLQPDAGRARTALFDHLGRFLRGDTAPKTSGNLTFRL